MTVMASTPAVFYKQSFLQVLMQVSSQRKVKCLLPRILIHLILDGVFVCPRGTRWYDACDAASYHASWFWFFLENVLTMFHTPWGMRCNSSELIKTKGKRYEMLRKLERWFKAQEHDSYPQGMIMFINLLKGYQWITLWPIICCENQTCYQLTFL